MKIQVLIDSQYFKKNDVFDAIHDNNFNEYIFRNYDNYPCVIAASEAILVDENYIISKIEEIKKIHYLTSCLNGSNSGSYFEGMFNGFEVILSILKKEDPIFYDEYNKNRKS
jgi:hypothetical protein